MEEISLAIAVVLSFFIDYKLTESKMLNHKPTPDRDNLPMLPAVPVFK